MKHWQGQLGGVAALVLLACGGTVDLKAEGAAGSGGTAGSSGSFTEGGSTLPPVGGAAAAPKPPSEGALAYDADADGLGRAIYTTSFATPGEHRQLTSPEEQAKQPAFSANGMLLAYAARTNGAYQIHVRTLETGAVKVVTSVPEGATSPAFSPDGKSIAFVTGDPETPNNRTPTDGDLMLLELAKGEPRRLLDADDLNCCVAQYLSPVFTASGELLIGTGMSIVGLNLESGAQRELVPFTGRIPNPQDPTPAPDGIRYAFSDYCAGLSLFIGRIDGSTGDTCQNGRPVPDSASLISADWGKFGFIAAEVDSPEHGVVLIDDRTFGASPLANAPGARNPAWSPIAEIPLPQE